MKLGFKNPGRISGRGIKTGKKQAEFIEKR
jgi:hypothetical protein